MVLLNAWSRSWISWEISCSALPDGSRSEIDLDRATNPSQGVLSFMGQIRSKAVQQPLMARLSVDPPPVSKANGPFERGWPC